MNKINEFIEKIAKIPLLQKLAFVVILLGAAFALYYFLVYDSKTDQLKRLNSMLQAKKTERAALKHKKRSKGSFLRQLQELRERRRKAMTLLPDKARYGELIKHLNDEAKAAQVKLHETRRLKEQSKGFYIRMPIALSLEGTFHQLAQYFNLIGSMTRIVNIRNLLLTDPKYLGRKTYLKAKVIATAYRLASKEKIKAAGKKAKGKKGVKKRKKGRYKKKK